MMRSFGLTVKQILKKLMATTRSVNNLYLPTRRMKKYPMHTENLSNQQMTGKRKDKRANILTSPNGSESVTLSS